MASFSSVTVLPAAGLFGLAAADAWALPSGLTQKETGPKESLPTAPFDSRP